MRSFVLHDWKKLLAIKKGKCKTNDWSLHLWFIGNYLHVLCIIHYLYNLNSIRDQWSHECCFGDLSEVDEDIVGWMRSIAWNVHWYDFLPKYCLSSLIPPSPRMLIFCSFFHNDVMIKFPFSCWLPSYIPYLQWIWKSELMYNGDTEIQVFGWLLLVDKLNNTDMLDRNNCACTWRKWSDMCTLWSTIQENRPALLLLFPIQ